MQHARLGPLVFVCLTVACERRPATIIPADESTDAAGDETTIASPRELSILAVQRLDRDEQRESVDDTTRSYRGHWRVDATTQWLAAYTNQPQGPDSSAWIVGWEALVTEPSPAVHGGTLYDGQLQGAWARIDIFGAANGSATTSWWVCVGDTRRCEIGKLPREDDCSWLDVSPTLTLALVACDGSLRLIEIGGRNADVAELPFDPDPVWHWGRGNWLALLEHLGKKAQILGRLGVFDLHGGKLLYERDDVRGLSRFAHVADRDWLGLSYPDHFEIVVGSTGERVIDLPEHYEVVDVSPDGTRIAALVGEYVEVIDLASSTKITEFEALGAMNVAWRQDGAVLFYGGFWPTHAADPVTGELLGELDSPVLGGLEIGDADPSWRWIHMADGSIVRTLDFLRIELGAGWARTQTGVFDGDPAKVDDVYRFRVDADPHAPARYSVYELEPWLRRPGLVQAFFAGEPIAAPRISAEALAELEAKR